MENQPVSANVIIPNLAVLIFMACGLVSDRSALESDRPTSLGTMPTSHQEASVQARLWQDPFSVLNSPPKQTDSAPAKPSCKGALEAEFTERAMSDKRSPAIPCNPANGKRFLILPVLTQSSNYSEVVEARLRMRYAVISALGRAQYIPMDGEHLHLITVGNLPVPFEEFKLREIRDTDVQIGDEGKDRIPSTQVREDGKDKIHFTHCYEEVVVLWLDEDSVDQEAAADARDGNSYCTKFFEKIEDAVLALTGNTFRDESDLKVIGPTTSAILETMFEDDAKFPHTRTPRPGTLLVARATASNDLIGFKPTLAGWCVKRTIAPDDALLSSILDELDLRLAKPAAKKHMVLISEWDSVYSRDIVHTMATMVDQSGDPRDSDPRPAQEKYVHQFSYLKGIDGRALKTVSNDDETPDKKTETSKASPESAGGLVSVLGPSSSKKASSQPERAEGQAQIDYLRRLKIDLDDLQSLLAKDRAEIASIGVLGSDIYDKILVLKALKKSFPRAVFFTTDLDAMYLSSAEYDYTRNLVVCSGQGLTAMPEILQGNIPPFRDSYQTALFVTCLGALNLESVSGNTFSEVPDKAERFEIGRTSVHRLGHRDEKPESAQRAFGLKAHSFPNALFWSVSVAEVLIVGAIGILTAWVVIAPGRQTAGRYWEAIWRFLLKTFAGEMDFGSRSKIGDLIFFGFCAFGLVGLMSLLTWALIGAADYWVPLCVFFLTTLGGAYVYFRCTRSWPILSRFERMSLGILLLLGWGALFVHVCKLSDNPVQEPWSLFDGISIWPSELMRAATIMVGGYFLVLMNFQMSSLKRELAKNYGLGDVVVPPLPPRLLRSWRFLPNVLWLPSLRPVQPAGGEDSKSPWQVKGGFTAVMASLLRLKEGDGPSKKATKPPVSANPKFNFHGETHLWRRYMCVTHFSRRGWRVIAELILGMLVLAVASLAAKLPITPARGPESIAIDHAMQFMVVIVYLVVLICVIDIVVLASSFVNSLTYFIPEKSNLNDHQAIGLVDDLTSGVARLVYYPFTLLFMIAAGRNGIFDAWDWPVIVVILLTGGLVALFVAMTLLQYYARRAKRQALWHLDNQIEQKLGGRPTTFCPWSLELLRERRTRVEAIDSLAFRPWYHNPVLSAVLIPIGGVGSLQLFEKLLPYFY